jgi:hypothetical protein
VGYAKWFWEYSSDYEDNLSVTHDEKKKTQKTHRKKFAKITENVAYG